MKRSGLQALTELRPMIKTCWEVLLRTEPPAPPRGNRDTLVFMMDKTLDAFFAALTSPAPRRWLARYPLLCESLERSCPCTRNPLLHYFVSGEQAVLTIVAKALPRTSPATPEAQLTFHYLAQHEIQGFCDLCRSNCRRSLAGIVAGRRRGPPRRPRVLPRWVATRAR